MVLAARFYTLGRKHIYGSSAKNVLLTSAGRLKEARCLHRNCPLASSFIHAMQMSCENYLGRGFLMFYDRIRPLDAEDIITLRNA